MKVLLTKEFGKAFIPKKIRPHLRNYLLKAGIDSVPYHFFGALFYLSIIITGLVYILYIYPILVSEKASTLVFLFTTFGLWVLIQLSILGFCMLAIYVYLDHRIFTRTKKIETVLHEFLRYVSENLKGGMSLDAALWDAIRPKFGVLAHEIRLTAKRVMTGQDVDQALNDFTKKYDSPMVKRSFNLIIEGMKGGGEVAEVIDRVEENLRETKELKEEISATNTTYVIFLTFIAIFIAPILFALAHNLLLILQGLSTRLADASVAGSTAFFKIGKITIEPIQFQTFSMWALGITAWFSAMIVSIIRHGNIKQGVKFIPIFIVISLLLYLFFKGAIASVFGGVIAPT